MDSETIIESSFEYTDGKMYRTIKVTMPPCDTNDDAAWAERNDLAERIRALLQAPAPQPPVQDSCVRCGKETVCGKTHCEACCYEPISAPQPSDDAAKDAARWDMLVKIYDHVLTHPDSRKHDAEYGRYKTAIEAGLGITGAIDAAMAGGE